MATVCENTWPAQRSKDKYRLFVADDVPTPRKLLRRRRRVAETEPRMISLNRVGRWSHFLIGGRPHHEEPGRLTTADVDVVFFALLVAFAGLSGLLDKGAYEKDCPMSIVKYALATSKMTPVEAIFVHPL